MHQVQLDRILDRDDLVLRRDEPAESVQERGLAACGASRYEERTLVLHQDPEVRELLGVDRPVVHHLDRRDRVRPELPDGEGRPFAGHLAAERQVAAAPVGEGYIADRLEERDMPPADLGEFQDEVVQLEVVVTARSSAPARRYGAGRRGPYSRRCS